MNTSPLTPTCKQVESMVESMAQAYAQTQQTAATIATQQTVCASQLMQVTSAYAPMLAKSQSLPDAAYTLTTLFGAYAHIMQQAFINQTRACGHLMQQTQTMAQRHAAMPWLQASQPAQPATKPTTQTLSERIAQRLAERTPAAPITSVTITKTKTATPKKTKQKATAAAMLVSALAAKAQLKWAQTQMETLTAKPAAPLVKAQQQWAAAIQQPAAVSAKVEVTTVADTADLMTSFPVPPTLPSAYPMVTSSTANSVMRVASHAANARSAHARGVRQSVMARRSARVVKVAR